MIFLIVEGADGSGKTTLCQLLSEELGLPIIHSGGPPKDREEMQQRIDHLLEKTNVIFDRFPVISDDVYGPICRQVNIVTREDKMRLLARRPIIIYCRPSNKGTLEFKDHETKEHIDSVKKNIGKLVVRYDEVMAKYDTIIYDRFTSDGFFLRLLVLYLREKMK